jgi:hypothetical protein
LPTSAQFFFFERPTIAFVQINQWRDVLSDDKSAGNHCPDNGTHRLTSQSPGSNHFTYFAHFAVDLCPKAGLTKCQMSFDRNIREAPRNTWRISRPFAHFAVVLTEQSFCLSV